MEFYVGTDVGGTFTDLWVARSDGRSDIFKSPTTPNVLDGVINSVRLAADAYGIGFEEFCKRTRRFGHGTTIGLNALLTERAARTAILTTRGFADTLAIGRLRRQTAGMTEVEYTDAYLRNRLSPLVPRSMIFEIDERMNASGQVVTPLDVQGSVQTLGRLSKEGVEAVAVCLLWATQNPEHERELGRLVREHLPGAFLSLSHEISPAVGEYARMSTTAANAALGPLAGQYLAALERKLHQAGMSVPILMMTCSGGALPAAALDERPVFALFSGPAAGVVGSSVVGRQIGAVNLLTTDIGGTSFDVGVVVQGKAISRADIVVAGADMRVSSIDVASIGAGGGSIARVEFGELRVGPQSAGANPGPACYCRGGELPTSTDADLVLGVLDPANFLGGRMKLDPEAACRAIETHVARPLGVSVREAAWGIREVLDNKMADLLRRVTIERGYDPGEFTLLANGGAGPSHAWVLSRELGLRGFVVPAVATAMSAYGTGNSDLGFTSERPAYARIASGAAPDANQCRLISSALSSASEEVRRYLLVAVSGSEVELEHSLSFRYRGQSHTLDIPITSDSVTEQIYRTALAEFGAQYERLFGHGASFAEAGIEIISVRTAGVARLTPPRRSEKGTPLERIGTRLVVFREAERAVETAIFATTYPREGESVAGPAIIEFPGQSIVIPPDALAQTDAFGNFHVRLGK